MHHIYTTEGFILRSANFGEANKFYFIFTKEFGLVKAAAQGVRLLKSKLRYGLEDYSLAKVALVRGRDVWRLTSAESIFTLKTFLKDDQTKFVLMTRIFSLLSRLLHGEEKNPFLFDSLREGVDFLSKAQMSPTELTNFEYILALRVLSSLGYLGTQTDFVQFTESPFFSTGLLAKMGEIKSMAILEINKSIKETHL